MRLEFEGDDALTFLAVRSVVLAPIGWLGPCCIGSCFAWLPFSSAITGLLMVMLWGFGLSSGFSAVSQGASGWRKAVAYLGIGANLLCMLGAGVGFLLYAVGDIESGGWRY